MHLEILVEDVSGKKALDILVPKIVGDIHTFVTRSYKGIGKIPKNLKGQTDASKRILLDQLPKLLKGYGKTFAKYPEQYTAAVVLVCDLDDRCLRSFRQQLFTILDYCQPKPDTRFCFAIEEGEAWLLGDIPAIKKKYPRARDAVLNRYINDSICGTWELMADALFPGGSRALSSKGWQAIGDEKSKWAQSIAPEMDVECNASPSFCYFRDKLRDLTAE